MPRQVLPELLGTRLRASIFGKTRHVSARVRGPTETRKRAGWLRIPGTNQGPVDVTVRNSGYAVRASDAAQAASFGDCDRRSVYAIINP